VVAVGPVAPVVPAAPAESVSKFATVVDPRFEYTIPDVVLINIHPTA
jgi:hypothetical protein